MKNEKKKIVYEIDVHELATYEVEPNDEITAQDIEEFIKNEDSTLIEYGKRTKTRSIIVSEIRKTFKDI